MLGNFCFFLFAFLELTFFLNCAKLFLNPFSYASQERNGLADSVDTRNVIFMMHKFIIMCQVFIDIGSLQHPQIPKPNLPLIRLKNLRCDDPGLLVG